MLSLRNVTLATALVLALAVGVAMADPARDVHEVSATVLAEVSNLRLFEPTYRWDPIPSGIHEPETLVEGHTVFVTLDFQGNRTVVEGNVTVTGLVHCETDGTVNTTEYHLLGVPVPVPWRVDHARVACNVYGQVIVTPTVYCQVQGDWDCGAGGPTLVPTGHRSPYLSPDGQLAELVEYTFTATPPGEAEPRSFYAYAVPILRPWIFEDDGLARNLWAPLPLDRLEAMDVWDFKFVHLDRVDHL